MLNDNIKELTNYKQWCPYFTAPRDNGKTAKIPVSIHPNQYGTLPGHNKKPESSGTLQQAEELIGRECRVKKKTGWETGKASGVGFMLTAEDPYIVIDLDGVFNDQGRLDYWAEDMVFGLNSYTEKSRSGKGVHIWLRGSDELRAELRNRKKNQTRVKIGGGREIECYESRQFIVMTGNVYSDMPIAEAGDAFHEQVRQYLSRNGSQTKTDTAPEQKSSLPPVPISSFQKTDEQVMELLFKCQDGDRNKAIWDGSNQYHGGNRSDADQALLYQLRYYTQGDPDQMERLFMQSPRAQREKVMERPNYVRESIESCLEKFRTKSVYEPDYSLRKRKEADEQERRELALKRERGKESQTGARIKLQKLSDVEEREATWLIPNYIPEGQITLIAGDGGTGKTSVWCNILAAITTGGMSILDRSADETREPRDVVFFSSEDSVPKVLKRKLRKCGANMDRVFFIDLTDDDFMKIKFNSPELEDIISELKPAVIVFDPLQAFIPTDIRMAERNAMRQCLNPLIGLGEKYGTTSLIVMHTNKKQNVYGRQRIADSADIWDISRSALILGYTEEKGIRYISQEKNSYAERMKTVLFTIRDEIPDYEGTTDKSDRDYMLGSGETAAPAKDGAKEMIIEILEREGEVSVKELDEEVKVWGVSKVTLDRAKKEMKDNGMTKLRAEGKGKSRTWYISLSEAAQEAIKK